MPKWIAANSPDDRVANVAARALKKRLKRVRRYLPLAAGQADEDVEHVHQLRVWTRRSGAAMRLFDEFLPRGKSKWVARQLKRIRKSAGDARDLDVLQARLTANPDAARELAPLLSDIERRRREAQPRIVELHDELSSDDNFRRRVKTMIKGIRWRGEDSTVETQAGENPAAEKPAQENPAVEEPRYGPWADVQLRAALEPFYAAAEADFSDLDNLHKFRIAGKQLRYAMELLAGAYPRSFRKELYGEIVALQEKLGDINDHRVARARFEAWRGETDDPAYAALLERLAADESRQLDEQQAAFRGWWKADISADLRRRFDEMLQTRSE